MERVLKLPVNEYWYNLIVSGRLSSDYREIKPYWIKRLENKEYDVVEFYHRFNKNIKPIRYKFECIQKGKLCDVNYNKNVYVIKFGEKIEEI
ncbi:MAG: hypothetical protein NC548_27510 [Lachnospiraceae bacterium]|nr:hypothetical protein [Lachnospiraceae bacterium]